MDEKQRLRERTYQALRAAKAARFPSPEGRIPNFVGAEAAARKLIETPEWRQARAIKCNPDSPQRPLRQAALEQGKLLFMAVPRLASERPFLLLDPSRLKPAQLRAASTIKGASELARAVRIEDLPRIDLIVTGCVCVSRDGGRIGKGEGYSDLEYALLREAGKVGPDTPIVSTVHPVQIVDALPMTSHDISLDLFATPDEIVRCRRRFERPKGIDREALPEEKREAIPVLRREKHVAKRARERSRSPSRSR